MKPRFRNIAQFMRFKKQYFPVHPWSAEHSDLDWRINCFNNRNKVAKGTRAPPIFPHEGEIKSTAAARVETPLL